MFLVYSEKLKKRAFSIFLRKKRVILSGPASIIGKCVVGQNPEFDLMNVVNPNGERLNADSPNLI